MGMPFYRLFPADATHDRLLRTLVDRALASPPTPQHQPAAAAQRPSQNARKGRAAAAQQAEQAAAAAGAPKQAAASQSAAEVLLDLAEDPSCSRAVLKLVLDRAGTPGREVSLHCLVELLCPFSFIPTVHGWGCTYVFGMCIEGAFI